MSGLEVTGGAAGVLARVADLRLKAGLLDGHGDDVAALAGRARGAAASGCLLGTAPFSPGTAARATGALLQAGASLALLALRLEGAARVLRLRAELVETADAGADGLRVGSRDLAEVAAGHAARALVLPALVGAVVVGGVVYVGAWQRHRAELYRDVLTGRVPVRQLPARELAAPGRAGEELVDGVTDLLLDPRTLDGAGRLLVEHPEITDAVTGGLPELAQGFAGPFAPLLPSDLQGSVTALLGAGRRVGLFHDPEITVSLDREPPPEVAGLEFTCLADLFASQEQLFSSSRAEHDRSTVRVREVVGPDGRSRWVVQVPGTQEWDPRSGHDPSDGTTNLELMDDGQAALLRAVMAAMTASGVQPDDEVLLTGHSQGGIAAVALASSPQGRAAFPGISHVVTAGSPVALFDVPQGITVLSMEHTRDPVPRLDGADNPDAVNWTTVRRDALPDVQAEAAARGTTPWDPVGSHGGGHYTDTAAMLDAGQAPGAAPVMEGLRPFLTGEGRTLDHTLTREQEEDPS